jgi:hypothetical protein
VRKISRAPSTQQDEAPFYRPRAAVRIRKVTIQERPPAAAARRSHESANEFAQTTQEIA